MARRGTWHRAWVRLPARDGQEAFVDAEDFAEVEVAALTEAGHAGRPYERNGPRLMTFAETVTEIALSDRDIRYAPLTAEAHMDKQRAPGVPEEWVQLSGACTSTSGSGGGPDNAHLTSDAYLTFRAGGLHKWTSPARMCMRAYTCTHKPRISVIQ